MDMIIMDHPGFDKNKKYPASYLGDGVYAIFDGLGIWLHANDHKTPTDRIYLEPEVLISLEEFKKDISKLDI